MRAWNTIQDETMHVIHRVEWGRHFWCKKSPSGRFREFYPKMLGRLMTPLHHVYNSPIKSVTFLRPD
jgi:hypothetical protein